MEIITSALLNAVGLFVALSGIGGELPASVVSSNQASVEVGLAELSPLGEAGGYAMPASEESEPRPQVTLLVRNATRGQDWVNQNISIAPEDEVHLKWTSNRVDNCKAVEHAERDDFQTNGATSGTDKDVFEPHPGGSRTYGIECRETNGSRTANADKNVKAYDAYLDFEARNMDASNPTWEDSVLTIDPGNSVQVRWKATPNDKAKSCTTTQGGFSTGGDINGSASVNDEPNAGNERDYTVRCLYEPNNIEVSRTITIKTRDIPNPPRAIIEGLRIINGDPAGGWKTDAVNLSTGDEAFIRWNWDRNHGRPATCEATEGVGFSTGNALEAVDTTINEPAAGTNRQYTVRCTNAGGSDSDSLRVYMDVDNIPDPTAKLELSYENSSGGWTNWTTENLDEVPFGRDVRVQWSSKNATKCDAMAGNGFATGGSSGNPTPGIDNTINEPGVNASMQITVRCENAAGVKESDSSTIKIVNDVPPQADFDVQLDARNMTNLLLSTWQKDALTVNENETVRVRWTATGGVGAVTCMAEAGSGFSTNPNNGATGEDNVVTPPAGEGETFKVKCTDSSQPVRTDSDTVRVESREALDKPIVDVTMRKASDSNGTWRSNLTIESDEEAYVKWVSTGADSCTGTGPGFNVSSVSNTDTTVNEPEPGEDADFTVTCTNSAGSSSDTGRLTVADGPGGGEPPVVRLEARNVTDGGSFSQANLTGANAIDAGEEIALRWSSEDAVSCSSNFGFGGGSQFGATRNGINPLGLTVYRYECESEDDVSAFDELTVNIKGGLTNPEIEVTDDHVRLDTSTTIKWDTNGNTGCSVTGPGVSGLNNVPVGAGQRSVVIRGQSTFVINCSGNTDEVTVTIQEVIKES